VAASISAAGSDAMQGRLRGGRTRPGCGRNGAGRERGDGGRSVHFIADAVMVEMARGGVRSEHG
jgi:hypothetical protein